MPRAGGSAGRARPASTSATAPFATARCSRRAAARSRPTTSELHLPRARFHAELAGTSVRRTWSSRSTCVSRTWTERGREHRPSPPDLCRPRRDRADRAPRLPDPLVALDVRRARSRSSRRSVSGRSTARRTGALVGYMIISRYVDAWHVMNIAVDADYRRRGIATKLLDPALRADRERRPARLHARGACLERGRDQALREPRVRGARHPAWLLHGQPRGRADHVEGPAPTNAPRRDPRHRDLVRRDRRRARHATTARSSRTSSSSQAELHARYGGVVPEVASRHHLELLLACASASARRGRRERWTTSTASPSRRAQA